MFPVIHLGPLAIQAPGLIMIIGFWLALELAGRQAARLEINRDLVSNTGLYAALAGVAGARLGYAALHWPVYRQNPLGLLALNPQTLNPAAGLLVGLLAAALYAGRQKLPGRPLLDAFAPALGLFVSTLALANLASGQAYGAESTLPWAIELWGARRHPSQLYELAAGLVMLATLWLAGRSAPPAPGLLFLLFVALYGVARLMLEPLRATSVQVLGGLRLAQVAGLAATLLALVLMRHWFVQRRAATAG